MDRRLVGLLLWAGWFLASAVICSLLKIAAELIQTRTLTPDLAQAMAGSIFGIIALIFTLDITEAYQGEQTS